MTTATVAAPTPEPPKFYKRDALREMEAEAQQLWEAQSIFEVDAPQPGDEEGTANQPKFMATFPYPYMNGRLHLGHSFSLSKAEFACGYQSLLGKRVLFPFGFHCTGMPIKACADKLKREVELFGQDFSGYAAAMAAAEVAEVAEDTTTPTEATPSGPVDPTKVVSKKGKVASKATGLTYQFQIMLSIGVPLEEIHLFADARHWLTYFPPRAIQDVKGLGLRVDWRRSFITTDVNPYYDSFIRWQYNALRAKEKIKFGERYTIYSPEDGQACMDHDRASGEGVGVQEYTGIKLTAQLDKIQAGELVKGRQVGSVFADPAFRTALGARRLCFVAATLRPETMYGQTNVFVGGDLEYGVFLANDQEAWVCTPRAARNMAWQGLFAGLDKGVVRQISTCTGWDLVGMPLSAPLCTYDTIYMLPMEGVTDKGTGVVTSVPSDSPDDYITVQDLIKKSAYYNILPRWVEPFAPVPILHTPAYGNLSAPKVVQDLKINSQKDKRQLAEAKELVYKEGFYHGTLLVGKYAGRNVQEAKPLIRQELIATGQAFAYCEPESQVISRSGDECVVTLAAQWYLDYGEETWKQQAQLCLERMNTFFPESRNSFEKTLEWLKQWACSRSFGLGSRLPWDREWLIESLSDSTIYMAYYTVAHFLQSTLNGSKPGIGGIPAEWMTDAVWDHILLDKPLTPGATPIPADMLARMKAEFNYFYPLDLRVSGKDLITNHLTFFIYNHTAIFPETQWPLGVRANGHLLINNAKMSKSTGNFMTLADALETFGADATRFALADAGDGLDDANFLAKTADDAILKLFTEREWIEEVLANPEALRTGPYSWNDKVFLAEMAAIIRDAQAAYEQMQYRTAVKCSFFDMQNVRAEYRKVTTGRGMAQAGLASEDAEYEGMHLDLVTKFVEIEALLISPIVPHWSEWVWQHVLKRSGSIRLARWPELPVSAEFTSLLEASKYIRRLASTIRSGEDAASKKRAKAKAPPADAVKDLSLGPKALRIFVAADVPEWQSRSLAILRACYDEATKSFNGQEKQMLVEQGLLKDKRVMPFVAQLKRTVEAAGSSAALESKLAYDELETILTNRTFLRRELASYSYIGQELQLIKAKGVTVGAPVPGVAGAMFDAEDVRKADAALPGSPTYRVL